MKDNIEKLELDENIEVLNINDTPVKEETDTFSVIKNYGEDLTKREYVTNPAIGREKEIGEIILSLITPDKSALLVGKPGIGKTAIVEGLGYKIQKGDVPDALKGWSIIKINIPSLLGSNTINGTTESRMELLLQELKNLNNIILFIDEIHLLVNRTQTNTNIDFANMLKPFLDRGTIKMIGATTTEEYETYILRDRAFLRRFQKIEVLEADQETVVKLDVKLAYSDFQKEKIFAFLTDMTSEYKRVYEVAARYPDITLTLLANAFSYAVFENSKEVRIKHIYKAIENAKNIYDDAKKKALIAFKEEFKDMLEEENVDLKG